MDHRAAPVPADDRDVAFMRRALALAARARGHTSPNPMVGCVIVRGGEVIAEGYHHAAGLAHAEVDALAKLGGRADGATVYVTLEPCNHIGRTGRCSEALIAAGVSRVVVGMRDPNPRVAGGGLDRLRAAGVAVVDGVLGDECRALNRPYLRWVTSGRPWVTLKAAVTLDGRLAASSGDARWVSNERSRKEAHRLRAWSDAILVGAGTVRGDDPALTTRLPARERGRDAKRVILDGQLSVPPTARALPGALVATVAGADAARAAALEARGAEVLRLPGLPEHPGRVDLGALLDALGARQVTALLVEGGGQVHGQFMAAGLVDEVALFVAPKLIGQNGVPLLAVDGPAAMAHAWQLASISTRRLGDDIFVVGEVLRS